VRPLLRVRPATFAAMLVATGLVGAFGGATMILTQYEAIDGTSASDRLQAVALYAIGASVGWGLAVWASARLALPGKGAAVARGTAVAVPIGTTLAAAVGVAVAGSTNFNSTPEVWASVIAAVAVTYVGMTVTVHRAVAFR